MVVELVARIDMVVELVARIDDFEKKKKDIMVACLITVWSSW